MPILEFRGEDEVRNYFEESTITSGGVLSGVSEICAVNLTGIFYGKIYVDWWR